uniref:Uncharacterized protein n=1 Tax=Rhizophora mucronata TaxID=61149 RepID=A0A2P2PWI8_RHIMU
MKGRGGSSQ